MVFRRSFPAGQVAEFCLALIGVGEIVQQPGQVLMFLLPEGTFGMVVTAPRPPQTEEFEGKIIIILVAPVFWNAVGNNFFEYKISWHMQVSGAEYLLE